MGKLGTKVLNLNILCKTRGLNMIAEQCNDKFWDSLNWLCDTLRKTSNKKVSFPRRRTLLEKEENLAYIVCGWWHKVKRV